MTASREAIISALFTLVSGAAGFKTTGRRLRAWDECPDQPALFLRVIAEDIEHKSIVFSTTTIHAEIWIYSQGNIDPDDVPSTDLNNLVDAVTSALAPDSPTQQLTLGGLVSWCRVEGRIDYAPGDIGTQAIAVIPVRILVPQLLAY
jgi:hypothetical protein